MDLGICLSHYFTAKRVDHTFGKKYYPNLNFQFLIYTLLKKKYRI